MDIHVHVKPFKACVCFSQELLAVEPSVFMKQPIKAGTIDSIRIVIVHTIYAATFKAET